MIKIAIHPMTLLTATHPMRLLRITLIALMIQTSFLISLQLGGENEALKNMPFSPAEFDGEEWSEINIPTIFGPPYKTRGKGPIAVPGHGNILKRRELIWNNTKHIPFDRFDCVVFVYADVNTTENLDLGGCKVIRKKGGWVQFQWMLTPELVKQAGCISVTLMVDDVLIAPPSFLVDGYAGFMLDCMSDLLVAYELSSISPNVFASDKSQMYSGLGPINMDTDPPKLKVIPHPNGFIDVGMNEIQLVMFWMTDSGWLCYHTLLDPELNPIGWGTDLCYSVFCNASLGW